MCGLKKKQQKNKEGMQGNIIERTDILHTTKILPHDAFFWWNNPIAFSFIIMLYPYAILFFDKIFCLRNMENKSFMKKRKQTWCTFYYMTQYNISYWP